MQAPGCRPQEETLLDEMTRITQETRALPDPRVRYLVDWIPRRYFFPPALYSLSRFASRRNESPIAQSRWPRWAISRSTGFESGTELDAPAGPKNGARSRRSNPLPPPPRPVQAPGCRPQEETLLDEMTRITQETRALPDPRVRYLVDWIPRRYFFPPARLRSGWRA